MGTGHVMRCLALAQAWQERGGSSVFAMSTGEAALEARFKFEGMGILGISAERGGVDDAGQTVDLARELKADWIVLDGYHFDPNFQQEIKRAGHKLMVVDDLARLRRYYADIVLNQNLYAENLKYSCEPYSRLLLGTDYVLLRKEFLKWNGWERRSPEAAEKVLVTLGGGDSGNTTLKVIQALQQLERAELEAKIVVGPSNPHLKCLEDAARTATCSVVILRNINDMPELMTWADVAVSGGGATCWELAYMGLPTLILVLAENQGPIAEGLEKAGAAMNLGWHEDVKTDHIVQTIEWILYKKEKRTEMSRRGRSMVDGAGAMRVCDCLLKSRE